MKDGFRAVLVRAAIETMRRAMATAARPMTMTALRAVGTGLEARSGRRVVTRALAVAHSPWSFAARGISDSIPTRGDDDKNAAGVPSTSAGDAKDVRGTAEERANKRKDLYMMFTCGKCGTRAAKGFSRQAYENGVVIVRCPGCQVQHLVADRYGWFGEPGSVEDFLKGRGETVVTGKAGTADDDGTLEIDRAQLEAWMAKQGVGATTNEEGES
jgi:protein import protein ZIM17|mmetsp:Transcript_5535/g.24596  ORF Transcript_5535/g.24596 Transcript_5535/m.24596 type:complete len:214 (-) Transcript_5535:51-692(-)